MITIGIKPSLNLRIFQSQQIMMMQMPSWENKIEAFICDNCTKVHTQVAQKRSVPQEKVQRKYKTTHC